jgi:hypothetical protein
MLILTMGLVRPGSSVLGRQYVVAQNAPNASDRNLGTEQFPWKTISVAAQSLLPGDTVTIHAGVYRELIRPENGGTADAPITYAAAPGEKVVITGADLMTGWERVPGDAPIFSIPWLHQFISGRDREGVPQEFHPDSAPLWGRAEQVIADGQQLRPEPNLEELRRAWEEHHRSRQAGQPISPIEKSPLPNLGPTFAGAFAVNTNAARMWVWLADGSDPNSHAVEAATRAMCFGPIQHARGLRHIHLRGLIFRYAASFPQRAAVNLMGTDNLVEDCQIEAMAGTGIAISGTMRRCTVRDCGHTGGAAENDGFVNQQCLWEGNAWKPINRQWDSAGVKMAQVDGGRFDRCVFRRNGGSGLWFDIDVRNVTVRQCIFCENEMSGLFVEISRGIIVQNNLAVRNGVDVVGHADNWGIAGIELGESMNCQVDHNTCAENDTGISFREVGPRPVKTGDGGTMDFHNFRDQVTNNVCAFNKEYQIGIYFDNPFFGMHPSERGQFTSEEAFLQHIQQTAPDTIYDPLKQQLRIDNNLYAVGPDQGLALLGVSWRVRHRQFNSFQDYVQATGWDTNGRLADPRFHDSQNLDYRLGPASPAVQMNAGWAAVPADWKQLLAGPQ